MRTAWLLLILGLSLATICKAQSPTGTISGIVAGAEILERECRGRGTNQTSDGRKRKCRLSTFCERIERARKEGDLPPELKPEALAGYLSVILAVQASSRASLAELKRTIGMFRRTMPMSMDIDNRP